MATSNSLLKKTAFERRIDVLNMVHFSRSGHIGGSFSCMDALVALYYGVMDVEKIIAKHPARDRFVLSKGHCAEALYAVLADIGFFPKENLKSFGKFDSYLAEHPTKHVPGVEIATGALGHGLSCGVGMAIGLEPTPAKVYVLMGDGELAEGSVWEAFMAAAKFRLGNLCALIDRNGLQISGATENVMPLGDLPQKLKAFGWEVLTVNGHEPEGIIDALANKTDSPKAVILETVKGFGSKLMENEVNWHHKIPNDEQYKIILNELIDRGDLS